jgi:hypothetical protein
MYVDIYVPMYIPTHHSDPKIGGMSCLGLYQSVFIT